MMAQVTGAMGDAVTRVVRGRCVAFGAREASMMMMMMMMMMCVASRGWLTRRASDVGG